MTARPLDAARDALIALQSQLIMVLAAQNAALAERVGELEERLARLERATSRNSGNSSLPPSLDDQPGRTPPPGKPRRGNRGKRKPGKQPGAPGSHLAWSANPDRTMPHFPQGACACGADLASAADPGVAASHQEVEVPEITAQVIQHDLHQVACACGRVHRAAPPAGAGAPGTVTYGLGLQAWCVYLMAAHAIPGAPVRGADRGADRRKALARVRALAAGPRRRRGEACEPADPGADHHRVGHLRR